MAQNRVIWSNTAAHKPPDTGSASNGQASGLDQGPAAPASAARDAHLHAEQTSSLSISIAVDGGIDADILAMRQLHQAHLRHLQSGAQTVLQTAPQSSASMQAAIASPLPQHLPLNLRMPNGQLHQHCITEFLPRPTENLLLVRAQRQQQDEQQQQREFRSVYPANQSPGMSWPQPLFTQALAAHSLSAHTVPVHSRSIKAQSAQPPTPRTISPQTAAPRTPSPFATLAAAEQLPRRGRLYASLSHGNKTHANNNTPDSGLPAGRPGPASDSAAPAGPSAAISIDVTAGNAIGGNAIATRAEVEPRDSRTKRNRASHNKSAESKSADAKTLQEIAKRIRETPAGLGASSFSLDALHAAAADNHTAPDEQAASGPKRTPTIISFRDAARAQADKLNTAALAVPRPDHKSAFAATKALLPGTAPNLKPRAATGSPAPSLTVPELASSTELIAEPVAANIADITITGVSRTDAAKLAHELRTPLSAIHSAAELLAAEQFGPIGSARYKEYAQDIKQAAAHTLSVIEAMLDPDYLATGHPRTNPVSIDLRALIASNLSAFAPLAVARAITITTELAETLPPLYADRRAVNQMLLNLLTNALKFTPKDGMITVAACVDPDGSIRLSICDSGPGMSSDDIRAVLHGGAVRARDGRGTTSAQSGINDADQSGLGFGLPIVLSLAKANGARVALTSSALGGLNASIIFSASNLPAD